jgi:hypothetical protein
LKFITIPELVEDENELLLCDPQSVVQREQQLANEVRREEIASGRKILEIARDHRSKGVSVREDC